MGLQKSPPWAGAFCSAVKEWVMSMLRNNLALLALAAMLSGCYIVPVRGPDGTVTYDPYPLPPLGVPIPMPSPAPAPAPAPASCRRC
jgi:hypothetical protein